MPRSKFKRKFARPDHIYNDVMVTKFINHIMKKGKKTMARKIAYGAFDIVKEKSKSNPLEVFTKAIENVSPLLEVRSRRVGGATYQVPVEVKGDRKISLAIRWILKAARTKKGKPMREKLAEELLAASRNEGTAIKKKEDTHRMAEANRAFAHLAW